MKTTRLLVLLAALLALGGCAALLLSSSGPDYNHMQRATVTIHVLDDDGPINTASGVLTEHGILTVAHGVAAAKGAPDVRIEVEFFDGERILAKVEKYRFKSNAKMLTHDLALLSTPVRFGGYAPAPVDCRKQPVGAPVYVVGSPGNMRWTVTEGTVITDRTQEDHAPGAWLITDALIWYGNSGGPIFTADGRVAGIAQSILVRGGVPSGHGVGMAGPRICEFLGVEK